MSKSIAIDFDGVIHAYKNGWQRGEMYDVPIDGCFEYIRKMMDLNYSVFIFSTRSPKQIKKWILPHIMISEYEKEGPGNDPDKWVSARFGFTCERIPFWKKFWNKKHCLGITRRKLPASVYIDDRALEFKGDWSLTFLQAMVFKTYQGHE
jgi:hypothetical protein